MASKRHALACAASSDNIYAVGGWEDGSRCTAVLEVFSPSTERWTLLAPMLQSRRLHGAALLDGHLYVFGGASDDQVDIKHAERYSLEADSWERIKDLPAASTASAAAAGCPPSHSHSDSHSQLCTRRVSHIPDQPFFIALLLYARPSLVLG